MEEKLILQLLEHQKESAERTGRLIEIVERHDKVTFPEINGILKRMESKQNDDIVHWNEEKAKLNERIKPLEEDLLARKEFKQGTKKGASAVVWDVIKLGVMGGIGYIISFMKHS